GHPLAAVARALQGLVGGSVAYEANQEQKTEQQKAMDALMRSITGQATANPGVPDAGGAVAAAPMPAPAMDALAPRGMRNNNPLNIESGNFTQSQPGYAGSDGRF